MEYVFGIIMTSIKKENLIKTNKYLKYFIFL